MIADLPKWATRHVDYAKLDWYARQHYARHKRYVEALPKKLICQECSGSGWFYIDYFPELGCGPRGACEWCEGTGYMTPHGRGVWLRFKREEKLANR